MLCQGQEIGNAAVITQWVLMFTMFDIYWKYKRKYRPQETDQQCCRKCWLQFLCFFEAKPWLALVAQSCGWAGAGARWWAGIHQSPQHWFVHSTFLHLCPSTSCIPFPFLKFFPPGPSVLSLQLWLLSLPHFLHSLHPQSLPALPLSPWCWSPPTATVTAAQLSTAPSPSKPLHSKLGNLLVS